MYVWYVCVCVYMYPWGLGEGIELPGAGVTDCCEGLQGTEFRSSGRAARAVDS